MELTSTPLPLDTIPSTATTSANMLSAATRTTRPIARLSTMARTYFTMESIPKTSPYTSILPADVDVPTPAQVSEKLSKTPRQLKQGGLFTYTYPTKRPAYTFLSASTNALEDLQLDPIKEPQSQYFKDIVSGKEIFTSDTVHPFAMAYAGFQFGEFAGQLGDGRVVNLFTANGYELQLKGAGKTPFSRFADGNAVLRSSIREYVISEYLHAIGIPSTRALAISAYPKSKAQRQGAEICAVVCRMAKSWVRIGNFDYCRLRGDRDALFQLCDYINEQVFEGSHSPELEKLMADGKLESLGEMTRYDKLFLDIILRNATAVAHWHAYGFLNGVLNTDNTSVLGLAIDFGPFAIMDKFDPDYTSNSEDHTGRYAFKNAPSAVWWNMVKLAEAMAEALGAGPELIDDVKFRQTGFPGDESVEVAMKRVNDLVRVAGECFETTFVEKYLELICARLGITPRETDNGEILPVLFETLQTTGLEYNKFFVTLQELKIRDDATFDYEKSPEVFIPEGVEAEEREKMKKQLITFLGIFRARVQEEFLTDDARLERASQKNPVFIPKNWVLQDVIDFTDKQLRDGDEEEAGKYLNKIMKMANHPYDKTKWGEELKDLEVKWLADVEDDKLMLQCSCSS
jgi:uncharacterized protein YdiU (UPF0061 family)